MTTELLFREDAYLKTATSRVIAVHERGIDLDRTIFNPQGGGQVGDTGALVRASGERLAIADTRKGEGIDSVLHVPAPGMPQPEPGETLTLEVDWDRRYALMRLHTALHVMSCVVVAPVTGGNISPDKARLDFGIDLQPCGGTHVKNIGEIGAIRVVKIRSEVKRNKRVEIALAAAASRDARETSFRR